MFVLSVISQNRKGSFLTINKTSNRSLILYIVIYWVLYINLPLMVIHISWLYFMILVVAHGYTSSETNQKLEVYFGRFLNWMKYNSTLRSSLSELIKGLNLTWRNSMLEKWLFIRKFVWKHLNKMVSLSVNINMF